MDKGAPTGEEMLIINKFPVTQMRGMGGVEDQQAKQQTFIKKVRITKVNTARSLAPKKKVRLILCHPGSRHWHAMDTAR